MGEPGAAVRAHHHEIDRAVVSGKRGDLIPRRSGQVTARDLARAELLGELLPSRQLGLFGIDEILDHAGGDLEAVVDRPRQQNHDVRNHQRCGRSSGELGGNAQGLAGTVGKVD
jgi:hypothetical protein